MRIAPDLNTLSLDEPDLKDVALMPVVAQDTTRTVPAMRERTIVIPSLSGDRGLDRHPANTGPRIPRVRGAISFSMSDGPMRWLSYAGMVQFRSTHTPQSQARHLHFHLDRCVVFPGTG